MKITSTSNGLLSNGTLDIRYNILDLEHIHNEYLYGLMVKQKQTFDTLLQMDDANLVIHTLSVANPGLQIVNEAPMDTTELLINAQALRSQFEAHKVIIDEILQAYHDAQLLY